jgi:hypothetical protein
VTPAISGVSDSSWPSASPAREAQLRLLRMLSLPLAAALVFFFVTPGGLPPFQPSQAQVRRQVVNVVEAQFEAFKEGDYARARSFAATALQAQFDVPAFERMVKEGYPVIAFWRALSVEAVQDNGREAVVEVLVQSRRGRFHRFRYWLLREAAGWRINGVFETPAPPAVRGQLA